MTKEERKYSLSHSWSQREKNPKEIISNLGLTTYKNDNYYYEIKLISRIQDWFNIINKFL